MKTLFLKPNNLVYIKTRFVCQKIVFFWKVVFMESKFLKLDYFLYLAVMKNKLENIFQYLVIP